MEGLFLGGRAAHVDGKDSGVEKRALAQRGRMLHPFGASDTLLDTLPICAATRMSARCAALSGTRDTSYALAMLNTSEGKTACAGRTKAGCAVFLHAYST